MMKNRITAGILSALIALNTFLTVIPSAIAAANTINISSIEDFNKFSENCTLDTWSHGKTVNLTCDIDFSKNNFLPIPTFGGTFNGNGHTISGIKFDNKGSYQGVFRYVQKGGTVSELNVKGTFAPNGSKGYVGAVAGENSGTLEKCMFDGSIKGEDVIGGIAGINTDYGKIISCVVSGNIAGENFTGGIAGRNNGFIKDCTNNASVNTIYEEKKRETGDIDTDIGSIIENYKTKEEENEEDTVLGYSDTGGIVGYTTGIVQGCINNGSVGYSHIGYNVGGIAGKQSGYMLGCQNYGLIQGRKDVGGIVGQAEPYIVLNAFESTIDDIHNEITKLNTMVNDFITDTGDLGDDAETRLKEISHYAQNAQDNSEILVDHGTDFIDDNIDEINAQSAILSNTIDKLTPVFDNLEDGCDDLSDALEKLSDTIKNIDIDAPELENEIDALTDSLSKIASCEQDVKNAVKKAEKASDNLDDAVKFNNSTDVKKALSDIYTAIKDIITAKQNIKTALEKIENILNTKPESLDNIKVNAKEIAEIIKASKDNLTSTLTALKTTKDSMDTVILNTELDLSDFLSAVKNAKSSVRYLTDALYSITGGIENLSDAIEDISDNLSNYTDDLSDDLKKNRDDLTEAVNSLSYATDDIKAAFTDIKNILTDLSNEDDLEFVKLDDEFRDASDNLFDSLSGISDEIDGLRNTVSDKTDNLSNKLTSISNQFNLITDLLVGEIDRIKDGGENITDVFLDVSDENIESAKQGKIEDCHNYGIVEADRNAGGIAGAMAVEYSKDPEDDIEKPNTLNFTYRTRTILQSCINDGNVTGKKDCIGGIVGLAEIGTVYECENYADTESTDGNYVGGIAGKSDSSIRKSYAKSKLTGKRYVGGIGGKADSVTACYTIVSINGDENTGAVCGAAENRDNIYRNYFVNNGTGAIDSISYTGKAEPISFEELKNINKIPARFISFTVTFTADDKTVETQDIKYGEPTSKIKYPEIPEKDGYFGNWLKPLNETVTENIVVDCEYKPYITVLSSTEKNENGKLSLVLAEGKFTDKAKLNISESNEKPPVSDTENISLYNISLLNTDIKSNENVTLRLLNENKDKITAWVLNDGTWEKVKTSSRGKYVIMQTNGTSNTICMKYEKRNFTVLIPIIILSAVMLVLILLIIKHKKTKTHNLKQ